jgi:hypothetical protein
VEQLEDRTTPSLLGTPTPVVSLEKFTAMNGEMIASLLFTLPGGAEQLVITPAAITSQQRAPHACPTLNLMIGPVHLDLLGLAVDMQPMMLRVQAIPGRGQLLGDLLCNPALKGQRLLNTLVADLNTLLQAGDLLSNLTAPSGPLPTNTPLDVQQLATDLASAGVTAGTSACPVLSLNTGPIDLNVLGLDVSVPTGIHLTVTAVPGPQPGNFLGNLLCALSKALDNPSLVAGKLTSADLTNILTSLVDTLQRGVPTFGILSPDGVSRSALAAARTANAGMGSHGSSSVVSLTLGPLGPTAGAINLNVLGLQTTSSPINLNITAQGGSGNVLGNLLNGPRVSVAQALLTVSNFLNTLTQLESGLGGTATGLLSNGPLLQGAIRLLAANLASTTTPTSPCPVLGLTLGPLTFNLQGLIMTQDNGVGAPVTVVAIAIPGPGNLLGNLLCDLAALVSSIP